MAASNKPSDSGRSFALLVQELLHAISGKDYPNEPMQLPERSPGDPSIWSIPVPPGVGKVYTCYAKANPEPNQLKVLRTRIEQDNNERTGHLGYLVTDFTLTCAESLEFCSWKKDTEAHSEEHVGLVTIDLWSLFNDAFPWEAHGHEIRAVAGTRCYFSTPGDGAPPASHCHGVPSRGKYCWGQHSGAKNGMEPEARAKLTKWWTSSGVNEKPFAYVTGTFGTGKTTFLLCSAAAGFQPVNGASPRHPVYLDLQGCSLENVLLPDNKEGKPWCARLKELMTRVLDTWKIGRSKDPCFEKTSKGVADSRRTAEALVAMLKAGRIYVILDNVDLVQQSSLTCRLCDQLYDCVKNLGPEAAPRLLVCLRAESIAFARVRHKQTRRPCAWFDPANVEAIQLQSESDAYVKGTILPPDLQGKLQNMRSALRKGTRNGTWAEFSDAEVEELLHQLNLLTNRAFFCQILRRRLEKLPADVTPDLTSTLSDYVISWFANSEVSPRACSDRSKLQSKELFIDGSQSAGTEGNQPAPLQRLTNRFFLGPLSSVIGDKWKEEQKQQFRFKVYSQLLEAAALAFAETLSGALHVENEESPSEANYFSRPDLVNAVLTSEEQEIWSEQQLRDYEADLCANLLLTDTSQPAPGTNSAKFQVFLPIIRQYLLGLYLATRIGVTRPFSQHCLICGRFLGNDENQGHQHRDCLARALGVSKLSNVTVQIAADFLQEFDEGSQHDIRNTLADLLRRTTGKGPIANDGSGHEHPPPSTIKQTINIGNAFHQQRKLGPYKFLGINALALLLALHRRGSKLLPLDADSLIDTRGAYLPRLDDLAKRNQYRNGPAIDIRYAVTDTASIRTSKLKGNEKSNYDEFMKNSVYGELIRKFYEARSACRQDPDKQWTTDILKDREELIGEIATWFRTVHQRQLPELTASESEKRRLSLVVPDDVEWVGSPAFVRLKFSEEDELLAVKVGVWIDPRHPVADETSYSELQFGVVVSRNLQRPENVIATYVSYDEVLPHEEELTSRPRRRIKGISIPGDQHVEMKPTTIQKWYEIELKVYPPDNTGESQPILTIKVTTEHDEPKGDGDSARARPRVHCLLTFNGVQFQVDEDVDCSDELPMHQVAVDPFLMDVYPVRNCEWAAFLRTDDGRIWGRSKEEIQDVRDELRNPYYMYLWDEYIFEVFDKILSKRINSNMTPAEQLVVARRTAREIEQDEEIKNLTRTALQHGQPPYMALPKMIRKWLQQPVVYINHWSAAAFARWVDKRLPSEVEWEIAARGGLVGKKYPWPHLKDPYPDREFRENILSLGQDKQERSMAGEQGATNRVEAAGLRWEDIREKLITALGGNKLKNDTEKERSDRLALSREVPAPSEQRGHAEPFAEHDDLYSSDDAKKGFGIAHLVGDISEWTQDVHAPGSYADRSQAPIELHCRLNPVGLSAERDVNPYSLGDMERVPRDQPRVLRGGSFQSEVRKLRCAHRDPQLPGNINPDAGFRCVMDF